MLKIEYYTGTVCTPTNKTTKDTKCITVRQTTYVDVLHKVIEVFCINQCPFDNLKK